VSGLYPLLFSSPYQQVGIMAKGIFCLEGLWNNNLKHKSTVQPILDMLELNGGMKYIHHDVATISEFEFYLRCWKQPRYRNFPILYLAFHGENEAILIGKKCYTLNQLSTILVDSCNNSILFLASCSTLNANTQSVQNFLKRTGALALCGYKKRVNWMLAAAFELLLLSSFQEIEFSCRAIGKIKKKEISLEKLFKELDFTIITKKDVKTGNK